MSDTEAGYTQDTRDHYNAFSESWNLERQHRRLRRIIDVMREERVQGPLIEFGALAGGFADWYARELNLRHDEVYCSDFADEHLAEARKRGFKTVKWDLEKAPPDDVKNVQFATVLFCEIVEHLVNPEVALERIVHAMRPGGALILTTPNLASLGSRVRLLLGKTPSVAPAPSLNVKAPGSLAAGDHLRVCVPQEWTALVEHVGLRVTRVTGCTSGPEVGPTLRSRLTLGLNALLERAPGHLYMNTLIVARKP